jgi:hypothetical protein
MKPLFLLLALSLSGCASVKPLPNYLEVQRETIRYWKPAPSPATYLIPAADSTEAVQYEAMPDSLPFVKVPPEIRYGLPH